MKKYLALLILAGCAAPSYEYQVHLAGPDGDGTMHLYTGNDKADALEYIKFYKKSHGDLKLVKMKKR